LKASRVSPSLMSLNPCNLMPHSIPRYTSRASSFSRFKDSIGYSPITSAVSNDPQLAISLD
jgi:hypothetical protein